MYCRCGHKSVVITPSHTGEGWGGSYMQLAVPKVVAIAVSTVMMMLRILPQRELLLKVPIVFKIKG